MSEDSLRLIINLGLRLIAAGVIIALFFGVRALFGGSKYCIADGCPSEAFGKNYCFNHKCLNSDCENARLTYDLRYCEECLERAGY